MAKAAKEDARSQSKIGFTPSRSRRALASEQAHARRTALQQKNGASIIEQPRLKKRKDKELTAHELKDLTLSQQDIEEILNGAESQGLLKKMHTDTKKVPRFHQDELSVSDKVLRFFDLQTCYGPAMGLTRLARWHRAHRLGKQPPQHIRVILEAAKQTKEYNDRYEMSIFGALH